MSSRSGSLLVPLFAPLSRRGAELLFEDTAEMRKVVETPCERDIADVSCGLRRIRQVAGAALQALGLDIAAERDLFTGHQVAGIARRDPENGCSARHRQVGVAKVGQNIVLQPVEQRRTMKRLLRRSVVHPFREGHGDEIERLVQQTRAGSGIDMIDRPRHVDQVIIDQSFERTVV